MKTFCLLLLLACCCNLSAHQNTVSFLFLEPKADRIEGRYDISVRNLDFILGLDGNANGEVTWGEIRKNIPEIQKYVFSHLRLAGEAGPLEIRPGDVLIEDRTLGKFVVVLWSTAYTKRLKLDFDLLFEVDPNHKCFVELPGAQPVLLEADNRSVTLELNGARAPVSLAVFLKEGVTHIFGGIDHICFLIALLLPSVWKRSAGRWEPAGNLKTVLKSVLKIVTAFTVAHSITLSLAALQIVRLPSALVESAIALSVLLAAVNNIVPIWNDRAWPVAFGFGLMHGFGFASVLNELTINASSLAISLFGFNLGVEVGQLCIVLVFVPLAFLFRETSAYRILAVRFGSSAIAGVAAVWLVERAFGVAIF